MNGRQARLPCLACGHVSPDEGIGEIIEAKDEVAGARARDRHSEPYLVPCSLAGFRCRYQICSLEAAKEK
jgi:hypothetical protein